MADRSVIVRLKAQVGSYVADLGKAKQSTEQLAQAQDKASKATDGTADAQERASKSTQKNEQSTKAAESSMQRLAKSAKENEEAWNTAGTALAGFGTVSVAALGATAKAAMDWESAWAGVQKTVDGSPEQMADLEAGLRDLAKTLPATHEEIAGVAEAAGQLGVAREDVVGFTQTMVDLSETTNLSADEAATSIAQISNVMGTMERDGSIGVARFGATLVALGNDGASTEKEIVMMAQRIAGAAKLVGASESDLLAMANAMASVGIEAQLGGGVMSRVMQRMYGDVMNGGEGLENLASVAGVSASEFATAFETDPVRAVDMMIKGLEGVKASGGNVIDTMSDLGIKGTEETSVILRLAGAGDLLTDSLDLGSQAWEANSALAEEAAKRYETTEAQVQVAWNNIKDAAIDAGAVLLPVLQSVAEGVSGLATTFGSLPAPVQGVLTILGGVAGVAAVAAGGFLLLFPKVMDTVGAFGKLAEKAPGAATGLQKVGKGAGAALSIAAVGLAIAKIAESSYMDDIDTGMGRVSDALAEVASKGPGAASALDLLFKDKSGGDLVQDVENLEGALDRTFNKGGGEKFNDWAEGIVNGATGIEGSSQILSDSWTRIDDGLSTLVSSGNAEDAAANFKKIQEAADAQGISVEDVAALFPQYADALAAVDAEQKLAAEGAEGTEEAIAGVGGAAEEAVVPLEEIVEALFQIGMITMSSRDSTAAFHDSLRAIGEATLAAQNGTLGLGAVLNETATDFDLTTEAGAAANAAFQDVAQKGMADVEAKAREGLGQAELQANLDTTYQSLLTAADGMHIVGDDAVNLARDVLGVPDGVDINTWMSDAALKMAGDTAGALNSIPGQINVSVNIATAGLGVALGAIGQIAAAAQNAGAGVPAAGPADWYVPGKATGGRIADIPGYAGGGQPGGRINYPAPSDLRRDNVLGMVNGKPIALQGREWVIKGSSSDKYDEELAAINAGTFPKYPGYAGGGTPGREYAPAAAGYGTGGGGMTIEMPITINGATDVNAVRQAVMGDITYLFQKNGVRSGG